VNGAVTLKFPTFARSATVTNPPSCCANDSGTIEARPLGIGTCDPLTPTAVDALGQVIYTCGEKGGGVQNVRTEISRGSSNSYDRRMTSGGDYLLYNILPRRGSPDGVGRRLERRARNR
jgi:hypothetical protein